MHVPQFSLTEYLWSEWTTQILLQFAIASLRSETLAHKSSVTENFIDSDGGRVLKSAGNHSSKNLLGSNYVAGITAPSKSFNLVAKNLKTTLPSGLWMTLSPWKMQTSVTPCHTQGQDHVSLWEWGSANLNGYELCHKHLAVLWWTLIVYIIEYFHKLFRCRMKGAFIIDFFIEVVLTDNVLISGI